MIFYFLIGDGKMRRRDEGRGGDKIFDLENFF